MISQEQLIKKIIFTLTTLLEVDNLEIIHCTLESLLDELEEFDEKDE